MVESRVSSSNSKAFYTWMQRDRKWSRQNGVCLYSPNALELVCLIQIAGMWNWKTNSYLTAFHVNILCARSHMCVCVCKRHCGTRRWNIVRPWGQSPQNSMAAREIIQRKRKTQHKINCPCSRIFIRNSLSSLPSNVTFDASNYSFKPLIVKVRMFVKTPKPFLYLVSEMCSRFNITGSGKKLSTTRVGSSRSLPHPTASPFRQQLKHLWHRHAGTVTHLPADFTAPRKAKVLPFVHSFVLYFRNCRERYRFTQMLTYAISFAFPQNMVSGCVDAIFAVVVHYVRHIVFASKFVFKRAKISQNFFRTTDLLSYNILLVLLVWIFAINSGLFSPRWCAHQEAKTLWLHYIGFE